MPYKDPEKRKECARRIYFNNKSAQRLRGLKYRVRVKLEALSEYGPNRLIKCSWPGCCVDDPDMLSLDHINNDGSKDRKCIGGRGSGKELYVKLRIEGWPAGFQTLCHNHQWKKEAMRRQENRMDSV